MQAEIIVHRGYASESHSIVTGDGYVLQVQRIPRGRSESASAAADVRKKPVFLQHGFLNTAADWVLNPSNISLGVRILKTLVY